VPTKVSGLPRVVWLAIAVGLVLRLGFGLGYWVGKPLSHDEREYLLLARSLTLGHGFTYAGLDGRPLPGEHFGRAPVYPLLLAAVIAAIPGSIEGAGDGPSDPPVAPRTIAAVKVLQACLGSAVILLLALLGWAAAGHGGAVTAAWLAATYPSLVWIPAFVFSETLFMVVALTAALLLTPQDAGGQTQTRPRLSRAAGIGLLLGAGVLVRPVMLFFILLVVAWWWWGRARAHAVVLVCAAALVVMPWSIRNTLTYGRFVAVASEGGITFWTGNHPLAIGEGDLAANPALKRANVAFRERHAGLDAEALEPLYYREALDWIRAHPVDWLALEGRKLFYAVVPVGPSYRLHSPLYIWGSVLPYLSALVAAIMGAVRLARRRRLPTPLLLLAGSTLLVSLAFFPQERFRIPTIDPVLIVLAAGTRLRGSGPSPANT
jgi:hypothetical protein